MVVLVLTACPAGLRGYLTRWLLEVNPGVFVGHISSRIRDLMWEKTTELVKEGKAIMVFSARNEQRLQFKVYRHDWIPTDFDGIQLMMRPSTSGSGNPLVSQENQQMRSGWSNQSQRRLAARARHSRT